MRHRPSVGSSWLPNEAWVMPRGPLVATHLPPHQCVAGQGPRQPKGGCGTTDSHSGRQLKCQEDFFFPTTLATLLQTAIRKSLLKHRQNHTAEIFHSFPWPTKEIPNFSAWHSMLSTALPWSVISVISSDSYQPQPPYGQVISTILFSTKP